jgi:hypothetical protein
MKKPNYSIPSSQENAKILFTQQRAHVTNVSAIWRPDAKTSATGVASANVSLTAANGNWLRAGVLRGSKGMFVLSLSYSSPERKCIAPSRSVPALSQGDNVYLEIDVDPKDSRVVFWVNNVGLDMGVLPGFKGGAPQVSWLAQAGSNSHMINGQLTDCAFATAAGWTACDLGKCEVGHQNLQDHHLVEQLSPNGFAVGDRRLIS